MPHSLDQLLPFELGQCQHGYYAFLPVTNTFGVYLHTDGALRKGTRIRKRSKKFTGYYTDEAQAVRAIKQFKASEY